MHEAGTEAQHNEDQWFGAPSEHGGPAADGHDPGVLADDLEVMLGWRRKWKRPLVASALGLASCLVLLWVAGQAGRVAPLAPAVPVPASAPVAKAPPPPESPPLPATIDEALSREDWTAALALAQAAKKGRAPDPVLEDRLRRARDELRNQARYEVLVDASEQHRSAVMQLLLARIPQDSVYHERAGQLVQRQREADQRDRAVPPPVARRDRPATRPTGPEHDAPTEESGLRNPFGR